MKLGLFPGSWLDLRINPSSKDITLEGVHQDTKCRESGSFLCSPDLLLRPWSKVCIMFSMFQLQSFCLIPIENIYSLVTVFSLRHYFHHRLAFYIFLLCVWCMHMCVYGSQGLIWVSSSLILCLVFESGSLTEPGDHRFV